MGERRGRMPWREFGCVGLLIVVLAVICLPALYRERRAARAHYGPRCQNNLKQFGLVFKMYCGESRGNLFPPIMATAATLYDCDSLYREKPRGFEKKSEGFVLRAAPLVESIYPEYISDPDFLMCPSNSMTSSSDYETHDRTTYFDLYCQQSDRGAGFAATSYSYTGYACYGGLEDEDDIMSAHEARQLREVLTPLLEAKQRGDGAQLRELADKDVTTTPEIAALGAKESKIYRLRDGVERFLITDANNAAARSKAQSEIWVMHDVLHESPDGYSHSRPAGVNVVCLDGHAEFMRVWYASGDESPATREMRASYALLD